MPENILVEVVAKGQENAAKGFEEIAVSSQKAGTSVEAFDQSNKDLTKTVDGLAKSNKDLQKAQDIVNQSTDGLTKKQIQLKDQIAAVGGVIQKNTGTTRENTAMNKALQTQLTSLIAEYNSETKAIQNQIPKQASLRSEIKQTREELARQMAAGELSTAQIYKMASGAGELKDAFGDASGAINVLSSDTFALDATIQTIQSMAAGFQVMQGVQALVGSENENMQKTLVKLNAIMAITQGLQQIINNLQRNSAQMLGLNVIVQKAYTFAVGESTGALRLFRLALFGLGLVAIVAGVYLAIKAFQDFNKEINARNKALSDARKEGADYLASEKSNLTALLSVVKNRNLSDETRKKALKEINENYPEYLKNLTLENAATAEGTKLINQQVALITKLATLKGSTKVIEDLGKKIADAQSAAGDASLIDRFTTSISTGNIFSNAEEATKLFRDKQVKDAKDQLKNLLALQKELITQLDKEGFGNQALEAIGVKFDKEVKEKLQKSAKESTVEVPVPIVLNLIGIDQQVEDAFEKVQQQISIAEKELRAEFSVNPNSESLESLSARLRDLIRQKEILEAQFNAIKNPPVKYGTNKDILGDVIPELPSDPIFEKDPPPPEITLFERIFGTAEQNESQLDRITRMLQGAMTIVSELNNIGAQAADIASQAIKIRTENEIISLDEKRKRGLISEKRFQEESARIKNDAARKQRAVDVAMAMAKVPMLVLEAYSSGLQFGPIGAAVLAALAGAFGLAQVALIASAPLPKFKHGGPADRIFKGSGYVVGPSHENGGVNANLEGNEFVMKGAAVNHFGKPFMESLNNMSFKMFSQPNPLSQNKDIAYNFSNMEKLMNENNDYLHNIKLKISQGNQAMQKIIKSSNSNGIRV